MSIYMDDISVAGGLEVKKGIKKCARMEVENKIKYSLSKTEYIYGSKGRQRNGRIYRHWHDGWPITHTHAI